MRTTLNLDDSLMQAIMKNTGITGKTKIINKALAEYLKKLNRESIMAACGKLDFDIDVRAFRDLELRE
ncbi:MAG: type II toxin-antitoxin system VapB family antitoxin [Candidatus Aminicenantes bacterium]|nr:type II toxin-antitoxin system VapB family antitoxin [Candidatus Aminicenantes bacterium]